MRRALVLVLVGVAAAAATGCSSEDTWPSGDQTLRMVREVWAQEWPDDWPCTLSTSEWREVVERNSDGDQDADAAFLLVHFERCGES